MTQDRYYSYSRYLQKTFGGKTYKVVVASGLTCPTRDGKLGKGGCAFCDVRGSSSYFGKQGRGDEVSAQLERRLPAIRERFNVEKFLAYFQSYTNTYADVDYLRGIYEEAMANPSIQGLCIGTRPDCLPDEAIDLLQELSQRTYISLELGVQSLHDPTLEWLARGHDTASSLNAFERLRTRAPGVHVCAHLMFGSPTEPEGLPAHSARMLSDAGVTGVKLHQLMVLEHTELARRFRETPFPTLSLEQYAAIAAEFIEHLSPEIYLERLCATASHADECLAPDWSRGRWEPHNRLRDWLDAHDVRQGTRLEPGPGRLPGQTEPCSQALSTI